MKKRRIFYDPKADTRRFFYKPNGDFHFAEFPMWNGSVWEQWSERKAMSQEDFDSCWMREFGHAATNKKLFQHDACRFIYVSVSWATCWQRVILYQYPPSWQQAGEGANDVRNRNEETRCQCLM